ncbi:alpha/beta hydrolase [Pseudaestuariivita rosea]|uniref:alpha/beta hydrolase n=1 Tax=Pseudaestuariivita rosea TaxID=2763263 RepID=UPI001ABADE68|nr:alpha/beta fold hydrolase [Pseudaestuariivita rosea]
MRLFITIWIFLSSMAVAETLQISGPNGPLEGEIIVAPDARHIVIIIPGSGPTDRNGNAIHMGLHSDTYKLLAEGLAKTGITTLRVDKRGFYGSSAALADPNDVTIDDYATDLRNWIKRSSEIAPCVWIAGHSEGGLVALVAAQSAPETLCGIILLATPGRPVGQLLTEQFRRNPANLFRMAELKDIVTDIETGVMRDPETISPALRPMFGLEVQRYMTDLFAYDPAIVASDWQGPALIIHGTKDIQVYNSDADKLQNAMPQAVRIDLSGATHMLKAHVPGQQLATYFEPELPLHADLVPAITNFITVTD